MSTKAKYPYIVGKADGIQRIFQVREGRYLGIPCKRYYMERSRKPWMKYTGTISNKSKLLSSREAAREVRSLRNQGKLA